MNLKSFFLPRPIDIIPSEESLSSSHSERSAENFNPRHRDVVGLKLLQSTISRRFAWLPTLGKKNLSLQVFFLLIAALFFSAPLFAHTINYALEKEPRGLVIGYYLKLGFQHIIPSGLDHILFVSALCLLSAQMKTILWQATAFTIAHSVTLALSMKSIIVVPPAITEPIIALSIVFVAIENVLFSQLKPWRVLIVFMFGLIHGMGFASALNEIGLPPNKFYTSILAFNGGVELGQMAIIVLIFSSIVALWGKKDWYRLRIVYPVSTAIAIIATYWVVQRLFFN
jgi:hydrogenase/urease accessory protein HupE